MSTGSGWPHGFDVSHYQPTTPSLTGQDFLIAKATEGTAVDSKYAYHIANGKKAGVILGAYHFNRSDVSIDAQVAAFLATTRDADLHFLDVEPP